MTPQEENEIIAEWAGLECRCQIPPRGYLCWDEQHSDNDLRRYWGSCPRHENGGLPPDYDRDELAVGLLKVLRAKAYTWVLQDLPTHGHYILQVGKMGKFPMAQADKDTIAAAIKGAVKMLLEHEAL